MGKDIQAWGIRRREIDMDKLALAYYMLARAIIEEQKETDPKHQETEPTMTTDVQRRREAA